MLLFKRKFLPAIRAGEKTQTIRLWKHRMMRTGQRSYIPGAGGVRITVVEAVEVDSLTDKDALPDGFATADALRAELQNIYGERLAAGYQAFRVGFELIAEEASPSKESVGR
ncbi:ASCH domain protein [Botrimarina colliarenosi]|uniref:ASCH domain protein n=1 Tax=Botrimarina colliarenosi TaxID=2528001 RepID=A0A5C6AMG2_9BACT|nr:ASCH domain-containing protein [Botrimarina colliarenosi]TWU00601.1 ASCH domain protein [Botrimarina colliarenosi]